METQRHKIQFWLNPKNKTHAAALQKLQESGREDKDYIIDAIIAYASPQGLSEQTLRRIIREELSEQGITSTLDGALGKEKQTVPERMAIPERLPDGSGKAACFGKDEDIGDEEDTAEDMTLGLGMLAAFEQM